jgi:uncharacterized OsmC-like protein
MNLREIQRPLKQQYRENPDSARITLESTTSSGEAPVTCSVYVGDQTHPSEVHTGVGGPGTAPCSGDLLLGSLAACAQITCQMVANAMGVPVNDIRVRAVGDLDLRGTLALDQEVSVGFSEIRLTLGIDAPDATAEQISSLTNKTEQYCVVMQTLKNPPKISTNWT